MNPIVELIGWLRGGIPPTCDGCGKETPVEDLIPISGGEWVCPACCDIILHPEKK